MCGGTTKTAHRPGGRQDAARRVSDAVRGAGRTHETLVRAKVRKRARAGWDTGLTGLGNRSGTSVPIQSRSERCVQFTGPRAGEIVSFRTPVSESTSKWGSVWGMVGSCAEVSPPFFFFFVEKV